MYYISGNDQFSRMLPQFDLLVWWKNSQNELRNSRVHGKEVNIHQETEDSRSHHLEESVGNVGNTDILPGTAPSHSRQGN